MLEFAEPAIPQRETLFVEVILPLAIVKNYTYRVPFDLNAEVAIGKRVVVQFGKSKLYTAIIAAIGNQAPQKYEAKYIVDVLDNAPVVNPAQLQFWKWIADYYLCNTGEVMNAALPSALKLASETKIMLNKGFEYDKTMLNDKEYLIVDALDLQPELTVSDVAKLLGQKTVMPILKQLFEKNIIHISEEVSDRYKPRKRTFLSLNPVYQNPEQLKELLAILERAPKQADAVLAYIQLSRKQKLISKTELAEASGAGAAAIKALVDKDILIADEQVVSRLYADEDELNENFTLSESQRTALSSIRAQFEHKDVVLLHGVTSSGKTEVYIRLIEQMMANGRHVL